MDDLEFGTRNKRGDWRPNHALKLPPLGQAKITSQMVFGWLKDYLLGWNMIFFAITVLWWFVLMPDMAIMASFHWGWALWILALNALGIFAFLGVFEWRLYRQKRQERRFKYNHKFPSEQPSDVFWFKSQNLDNFLRSLLITVPIGTALEVLCLWLLASGRAPFASITAHPVWIAFLVLIAPALHEVWFFFIHRLIHTPKLYKWVHSVHHNSVNPSPWSSLSMHPVEGFLYFGALFIQLLLHANPFVIVYQWNVAAFGALIGHIGFDKMEYGEGKTIDSHAYAHYLHHKYFEVNYCDDGVLPLDKWFGTWHDGTPEGDRLMQERFQKKKQRKNKGTT